jgi:retinol dehydrogenase 12
MNPGNLNSELYRHVDAATGFDAVGLKIFTKLMLYPVINGAYTELFAGLSPQVTIEKSGSWSTSRNFACFAPPCSLFQRDGH